ncbi:MULTISPECIES: NAD-dependent epimerase [unclassified Butyricimonas]|nr:MULTISPECIES: NAD-dependent epimerase [unclassified Butyricimonas]OUN62771.1 NAD-dependent epimerase [Butyricimonas sp. An62]
MRMLVTGAAGFIGAALIRVLLQNGHTVYGIDNLNSYYDIQLKYARLKLLGISTNDFSSEKFYKSDLYLDFYFGKIDLLSTNSLEDLFEKKKFDVVINLAAQAGVRYSLENPKAYIDANVVGFFNILECCRHYPVKHLLYASSSSVYGLNENTPFKEKCSIAHPVSLYAATKKFDELAAHVYSYLYNIPTTGLRFFTVYGPWGRPDMSPYLFTDAILNNRAIKVFNNGNMLRDFTYIDDVVEGIVRLIDKIPICDSTWNAEDPDPSSSICSYRIYNIGNSQPIKLMDFIMAIEEACGKKAVKEYLPMQPGDVYQTNAETTLLQEAVNYKPSTLLHDGVKAYVEWYKDYYKVN